MKHTPGPWRISKLPKSNNGHKNNLMVEFQSQDRAVFVAEVPGALHYEESKANASLIASAPELLKALINLVEDVEYAQPQIKPGLIGNIQIRKAREAIAKAQEI